MDNWANILVRSTNTVFLLKTVLVIAAGGFLTTMLANRPATTRYRIWSGIFLVLAILPIVHFGFTGWTLPVPVEAVRTPILQEVPAAIVTKNTASGSLQTTNHGELRTFPYSKAMDSATLNGAGVSSAKSLPFSAILWIIWLSGTLFLILRLILGRIQAHRLFRHSLLLNDDSWSFVIRFVRRRLGLRQNAAVSAHPKVPIPLTYGTVRPVVMLPSSATDWSMERRRIVLLHEFAHIRRRDDLTRLAARAVAIFYWFNPLSWLAFRKFKMEQEKSCDERVIRSGIRPSDYAAHLVGLARSVDRRGAFRPVAIVGATTLGMARKPELEGRLSEILNNFPQKETSMKFKIAGMFFLIAFGMLLVVQPVAKAREMAADPVVAAPAKVAKVETQAKPTTPETPEKAPKAPKEPKAPKAKKVICRKIVTTVSDDGNGKIIIIKDGDKVQKIHVDASGEKDNVIFLGDDGDKAHNVIFMKEFKKQYKAQMKAAIVELKQAMELLAQKKKDLAELNREMAKSMGAMKVNSAAAKAQLKAAMAKLDSKLKAQIKKNEAAMAKLKEANEKLSKDIKHQQMRWVEKNHEMNAIHMEKLARKHVGKVLVWVDEDNVDGDHDGKALLGHKDHMFIGTDGDSEIKIKLKVELKGLEKKDRKAIDKALKKFKKALPKGVKLDSNRDDNGVSLDINVPKSTKLSDDDQKKLDNAVDKLMDQIREIKGDKEAEIREIHIKKK